MKNQLVIENLDVVYEAHCVLSDFRYSFSAGLHAIVGPNGCGKSSLLKTLAGINPYARGSIRFADTDLKASPRAFKRHLHYVPDKPEVYPFMTGRQFLQLFAAARSAPVHSELMQWIDQIRLRSYLDIPFGEMSFGTRRKLMLSALFIGSPSLLLLDEPFNGLDSDTQTDVIELLNVLRQKMCIVVASHGLDVLPVCVDSETAVAQ